MSEKESQDQYANERVAALFHRTLQFVAGTVRDTGFDHSEVMHSMLSVCVGDLIGRVGPEAAREHINKLRLTLETQYRQTNPENN